MGLDHTIMRSWKHFRDVKQIKQLSTILFIGFDLVYQIAFIAWRLTKARLTLNFRESQRHEYVTGVIE